MGLRADNLELLGRSIARVPGLLEADADLERSLPSPELYRLAVDGRTSIEIVRQVFATYADRPALGSRAYELTLLPSGQRVARFLPRFDTFTYGAVWDRIASLATALDRLGLAEAGDIVCSIGASTVDHVTAELACHYLMATWAPLAKNVGARELQHVVAETGAKTLFCTVTRLEAVVTARAPTVTAIVVLDVIAGDDRHVALLDSARAAAPHVVLVPLPDLVTQGAGSERLAPRIPAADRDPLLGLVYTSGSTGTPKGAMFHEKSWRARWSTLPFLELTKLPMVSVVFLPQNHMGGRNAVANSLKLGGLACFTLESDTSSLLEDLRILKPTYIHLVPRLSETIYQHFQTEVAHRGGGVEDQVMAEMRAHYLGGRMLLALTASAPTPPAVAAFIKRCFDIPIVDVFAGTEYGQLFIDGSVNRKNVLELRLVSVPELGYLDTDQPYPRGELHVKTARGIASYFKNEAATRALLTDDGFMRTGDVFEQRGPDELVWIDRRNNVQKLAQGEFVNIWKLEALFATGSRFIEQVHIQGDSTRAYLLAVVVPSIGEVPVSQRTVDSLRALIRAELNRLASAHGLAPYEVPRDFLVEMEPFSRDNGLLTSLDKPARPALRKKYGSAIEQLYDELDRRASDLARTAADDSVPIATQVRRAIAANLGVGESALDLSQQFRNLGGDSVAAANLTASIERAHGVRLSVGFVLGPSTTLGDICRQIEMNLRRPIRSDSFERIHGAHPDAIAASQLRLERFFTPPAIDLSSSQNAGHHVLLTGATGFLGRFLCLALLERAARGNGMVTCLVRARSDHDANRRLVDALAPSPDALARLETLAPFLETLASDLEKPDLGLSPGRYQHLANSVGTVVHAAALVNHALPYEQLFEANVVGTAALLRLSVAGAPKSFNFVSTNTVSLALLGDRTIARETDDTRALGDGWSPSAPGHANGYRLSKWAGEVLAQDVHETYGVPVNVFRCNLIMPPARWRRQVNPDDFLTRLVRSVVEAGIRPRSFYDGAAPPHLDGFAADFIAEAIAAIASEPSPRRAVYHLNNVHWDDGASLDSLMRRLVARGYKLTAIEDHAEWFARFESALRALDTGARAASSLAIIDQWRVPLAMDKRQRIDAAQFRERVRSLRPQGLTDVPHLEEAYFDAFIDDLVGLGLIPSP